MKRLWWIFKKRFKDILIIEYNILVIMTICKGDGCKKSAIYNNPNEKTALYCRGCKLIGMIDIKN